MKFKIIPMLVIAGLLALGLAGCDSKSENAGEKVGGAMKDVKESVEHGAEKAKDAVEEGYNDTKEAAEDFKEGVKEGVN